ncbi:MAG: rhomboid family intramembrane serine protease [Fluviicola sp.]|nr:rhomboid family intramembrane serine protease [Fluviicola sp.]
MIDILGTHYFGTVFFEPYQIITHMFMHSMTDFMHILFNMLLLFMFGAHLEKIWGAKRYFIFYIACGLGSFALYNGIGVWQILELKNQIIAQGYDITSLNHQIVANNFEAVNLYARTHPELNTETVQTYINFNNSNLAGASGAIFGLLAGFAILFPNTKLMLLFPPIPIKAKYLIGGYIAFEVYSSIYKPGDTIAHLAHVGGAVVGIILVLIWKKKDRKNFY